MAAGGVCRASSSPAPLLQFGRGKKTIKPFSLCYFPGMRRAQLAFPGSGRIWSPGSVSNEKSCKKPGISCQAETQRFDSPSAGSAARAGQEGQGTRDKHTHTHVQGTRGRTAVLAHRPAGPPQPPSSPQHNRENLGSSRAVLTLQASSPLRGQEAGAPVHPQIPVLAPPHCHRGVFPRDVAPVPHSPSAAGKEVGRTPLGFPSSCFAPTFWGWDPHDRPAQWGRWYRASVSPAGGGAVGLRSSRNPQPKPHSAASWEGINMH